MPLIWNKRFELSFEKCIKICFARYCMLCMREIHKRARFLSPCQHTTNQWILSGLKSYYSYHPGYIMPPEWRVSGIRFFRSVRPIKVTYGLQQVWRFALRGCSRCTFPLLRYPPCTPPFQRRRVRHWRWSTLKSFSPRLQQSQLEDLLHQTSS